MQRSSLILCGSGFSGVFFLFLSFLVLNLVTSQDVYHGPTSTPLDVPREGAVYGNDLGREVFFAGLNNYSPTAFEPDSSSKKEEIGL